MAIVASEIQYFLSGGTANTSPIASLGGAISSTTQVVGSTIFDAVSSAQSAAGLTEYRCIYVKNTNATLTMENAVIWLPTNTTSTATAITIGVGTSAINGTEQAILDEADTAGDLTGVTFSAAASEGTALSLGNIPAGQHKAVWLKRVVDAGASASNDTFTVRVKCDTAA